MVYLFNILNLNWEIDNLTSWIYGILILFIVVLIILENRSPVKTVAWIIVITLIPVVGVVFYFFFGQEYRKKKMLNMKGLKDIERLSILSSEQLRSFSNHDMAALFDPFPDKLGIAKMLLKTNNSFVSSNKKVTLFHDGQSAFDDIIREVEKAKHHIHIEFYIIKFDRLGERLFDVLKRKATEGVEVRIIYDSVGSFYLPFSEKARIKEAGIKMHSFLKVFFPFLSSRVNYRNHRKIIIIDGVIGYTGGLNIADRYVDGIKGVGKWRDTFVKIEGNSVRQMQSVFSADWHFVSKSKIDKIEYYPTIVQEEESDHICQIVSSGPDSDWPNIEQFYFSAIASAQKRIYLASPYFIPPDSILDALQTAALRGVDVRILIPRKSDARIPKIITDSFVSSLLDVGIGVYKYNTGFTHSKLLMCDGVVSSVGSANMDFRSLDTNFEMNAIFYDEKICKQLEGRFLRDLEESIIITPDVWNRQSKIKNFISSLLRILAPLM